MSSIDMPVGPSTKSDERAWTVPRLRLATIMVALVGLALVLRLWELGERPLHHDESLDAWWSWLFRNGRYDGYDPVYHGPLRFYITAGFFELFGESEAVARLFSALTGTAAVGLPWFLRRELGRTGTIAAAVALCLSPTMLYYSRFGREDAQIVFLSLLALVLGLAYLRRPRTITAASLAFVLACSFAIKESTYLFGLLLGVYALVVIAAQFDAQNKAARGLQSDPERLSPSFVTSAIVFASIGLTVAVVVGAASDELFAMLALYGASLVALTVVVALPRLRAAQLRWSWARAALWLATLFAIAAVVVPLRGGPAEWEASPAAIVLIVALAFAGLCFLLVPTLAALAGSRTLAAASLVAAAGLGLNQWIRRELSMDPRLFTPEVARAAWTESAGAVTFGIALVVAGTVALFAKQLAAGVRVETREVLATPIARTYATAGIAAGLAIVANDYLEIQSSRSLAIVAVLVVTAAAATLLSFAPERTNRQFRWPALLRAFGAIGWVGWAITLAVFAITWFVFFSVFGSVKQDWAAGFTRAIEYWDSQQEVNRGGQPWYYYLYALPAYEWLFVALAAIGSWRALRRPTIASALFVWLAIGSVILYSYAGERMPWLIAHPLLPILVLAGLGVQHLWVHRDHRAFPGIATAVTVGLLLTTAVSMRASFPNGADSREILSQAGQATPHLTAALERLDNIDRIKRQTTGEGVTLAIGSANAWPYNWYLRERENVRWFSPEDGPPTDGSADVIIVDYSAVDLAQFPDYQATLFAMRSWWVPTYTEAGLGDWFSWIRGRELWDQGPNPDFFGVREAPEEFVEPGLSARLRRLRDGVDDVSGGWVDFATGSDDVVVPRAEVEPEAFDDGRDGCGSVDQWFLVRNDLAFTEAQVYPGPIAEMGPLACGSDLVASG